MPTEGRRPAAIACGLLLALILAPSAAAAVPNAATRSFRVITQPGAGAADVGGLAFGVTYTDRGATAVATPSPLRLAGSTYRIRTCVWTKAAGTAPASACEELTTQPDARAAAAGIVARGASTTVARPAAGRPPATIACTQDSICREDQVAPSTAPLGSAAALGALPFASEVAEPAGGRAPRGVMLILHGGAWSSVGEAKLRITRGDAERWRARLAHGERHLPRLRGVGRGRARPLDGVRRTYGDKLPVCALGRSAGGHLALLLAARRPKLGCVVAQAALADLPALARQTAATGRVGPATVNNWATAAFGADRLAQLSRSTSPCAPASCTRSRPQTRSCRSGRRRRSPRPSAGAVAAPTSTPCASRRGSELFEHTRSSPRRGCGASTSASRRSSRR